MSPNGPPSTVQEPARVVMRRADGKPIHVLVVDDEPVLAELVSMALRYEGWEIATAGDGATAIALARADPTRRGGARRDAAGYERAGRPAQAARADSGPAAAAADREGLRRGPHRRA